MLENFNITTVFASIFSGGIVAAILTFFNNKNKIEVIEKPKTDHEISQSIRDELRADLETLRTQQNTTQKILLRLIEENNTLLRENKKLMRENDRLHREIQTLTNRIKKLEHSLRNPK